MSDPFLGKQIGKYRIEGEIGRGGMGVVYRGTQLSLNRPVAIKVLPSQLALDPEFTRRFRQEAEIIAGLAHENIVYVYDIEVHEGSYFIIMEYLDGRSLRAVRAGRRLSIEEIQSVGLPLARSLEYAHQRGIIHRDVKSANVMITQAGKVKLMDFGIARVSGSGVKTRTGTAMGTPEYMAPEQARAGQVSPASDIYSLGVVLYELATGRLPFTGEDPFAVALQHISEEPPRPRSLQPEVPEWLEEIILKAMAKEPGRRYHTAAEMEMALAAAGQIPAEPVTHVSGRIAPTPAAARVALDRPPSGALAAVTATVTRVSELARRSPLQAGAVVLGVVGVLIAAGLLWPGNAGPSGPDGPSPPATFPPFAPIEGGGGLGSGAGGPGAGGRQEPGSSAGPIALDELLGSFKRPTATAEGTRTPEGTAEPSSAASPDPPTAAEPDGQTSGTDHDPAAAEALFQGAIGLYTSGQYEAAVERCQMVLSLAPGHTLAAELKARSEKAIQIRDKLAEGRRQLDAGRPDKAVQAADQVLALEPGRPEAVRLKQEAEQAAARQAEEQRQAEATAAVKRQAAREEQRRKEATAGARKAADEAEQGRRAAEASERQKRIEKLWEEARALEDQGHFEELGPKLEAILALDPKHEDALSWKARLPGWLKSQVERRREWVAGRLETLAEAVEDKDLDEVAELWGGKLDAATQGFFEKLFARKGPLRLATENLNVGGRNWDVDFTVRVMIEGRERDERGAPMVSLGRHEWRGRLVKEGRSLRFATPFP